MAENNKTNQELIHKLQLVQEFLGDLYAGRRQYRPRIAFISNTLDEVITQLQDKQVNQK